VVRTYKKFQAVVFEWPRHRAHLGQYFKLFLLVHPHSSSSLFDGSFSWSWIDLDDILSGSIGSSDGSYHLIFKRKNVALLEQMSRFDNSRFVKIGSCTFNAIEDDE
jgi:hypothetical protein